MVGILELLIVLMVAGSVAVVFTLLGRWAIRSLGGSSQQARLEHVEAEVKRLAHQEMPQDLEDEVRRLDEKVEFLEALLADRPKTGALPAGDMDDSGADRP